MRTLAILATATTLMSSPVMAASGKLYRCTPKDLVTFKDDGRFGTFPTTFWQDQWTDVLIDTATGLIRWKDGTSQSWVVERKGNDLNDHVLAGTSLNVNPGVDLLRLRDWKEKPQPTFILTLTGFAMIGTCTVVR